MNKENQEINNVENEALVTEDTATEEVATEEAIAEEVATEEAIAEEVATEEAVAEEVATEETATEEAEIVENTDDAPVEQVPVEEDDSIVEMPSEEDAPTEEAPKKKKPKKEKPPRKPVNVKKLLTIIGISVGGAILVAGIVLACIFLIKSDNQKALEATNAMFDSNAPSKIVVNTTVKFGDSDVELIDTVKLEKGTTRDGKSATVYEYIKDSLTPIEDGSVIEIIPFIRSTSTKMVYLEGRGVKIDDGRWDSDAYDFAPRKGDIALNLTEKKLSDVFVKDGVIYATIPAEHTAYVIGEEYAVEYDVELEIKTYGGFVSEIIMSYVVEGTKDYPDITVTIKAEYSYFVLTVNVD